MHCRSLRRAGAPLALAVALSTVAAPRAGAQPACAAGALDAYTASGFTCTIGNWLLHDFLFDDAGGPSATDAVATLPDPLTAMLLPFTGVDARGRATFGFDFTGMAASARVTNGTTGNEDASASFVFTFGATSLDPLDERVAHTTLEFQLNNVVNVNPGRFDRFAGLFAAVGDPDLGLFCLGALAQNVGQDSKAIDRDRRCDPPRASEIVAIFFLEADLARDGGPRPLPIDGSVTAQLDRIEFAVGPAVVPEPATVALVGGGLLALAGVAAGRRRG
jgi:hypothetical protein